MMQLKKEKKKIIPALQADYRMMMDDYLRGPAPGGELRAFSPVMLWALPIVLLSKAFSLLGFSAVHQLRALSNLLYKAFCFSPIAAHQRRSISSQAESLIHHNLGHRPRSAHRPRSSHIPRSGHIPGSGRPLISVPCPRLSTTCSKPTPSRYACHPGSKHHLLSNHQYSHPAMLWKII
jgi:hypothetical protein